MTLPPIVERELRVASRQSATYWSRFGGALILVALCFWGLLVWATVRSPTQAARVTFDTLSWWIFGLALLAGLRGTADCLNGEKRQGTLGLLFLTDLKSRDIVLGKLVTGSLRAVYILLAALPVLAIPVIAGGVSFGEFFRTAVAQVNALFFALAVGLLASTFSRDDRQATLGAGLLLAAFLGYHQFLLGGLELAQVTWRPPEALAWGSPWHSFARANSANQRLAAAGFWYPLLTVHLLAWGCLLASAAALPGQWQDRPAGRPATGRRDRWRRWLNDGAAQRQAWRRRWLSRNPFFWLATRDRVESLAVWAPLGVAALGWIVLARYNGTALAPRLYVLTAIVSQGALKLWLATQAGRRFALDRQNGGLELLLSTPLTVGRIIRGQHLALRHQFLLPSVVVLLADVLLLAVGWTHVKPFPGEDGLWTATFAGLMVVFVADMVTMAWVGMWLGISTRHANTVTGSASFRVLVIPTLVLFGAITLQLISATAGQRFPQPWSLLGVYVVASLVNDAFWTVWCSRRLHREFRRRATERYEPARPSIWQRFLDRSRPVVKMTN